MKNYVQFGKLRQGAEETASFVEGVNDLFDVLNSPMKSGELYYVHAFLIAVIQKYIISLQEQPSIDGHFIPPLDCCNSWMRVQPGSCPGKFLDRMTRFSTASSSLWTDGCRT